MIQQSSQDSKLRLRFRPLEFLVACWLPILAWCTLGHHRKWSAWWAKLSSSSIVTLLRIFLLNLEGKKLVRACIDLFMIIQLKKWLTSLRFSYIPYLQLLCCHPLWVVYIWKVDIDLTYIYIYIYIYLYEYQYRVHWTNVYSVVTIVIVDRCASITHELKLITICKFSIRFCC